jgi:hypothetical protein
MLFPFMRIPPESRILVYRHALVRADSIEICPVPHHRRQYRSGEGSESHIKTTAVAKDGQMSQFNEHVRPFVNLMRASKQVHKETAYIFYGENEFKFSNETGWPGLKHSCTISMSKWLRLSRRSRSPTPHPCDYRQLAEATPTTSTA